MSAERNPDHPRVRALSGGRRASAVFAGIRLVVSRADDPPFSVDAAVFEEDTWLALSTPATILSSPEHPVRVMTQAWNAHPRKPGTVVVRAGCPTRLLAVVHDLDRDPSWTSTWVERALREAVRITIARGHDSLRLPLLGTKHGRLPPLEFVRMLRQTIVANALPPPRPPRLRRIWIARGEEDGIALLRELTGSGEVDS